MIRGTDIRLGPYIAARMLHGILAAVMTVLVWRPVAALATSGLPMPFTVGIGEASFLSRAATSLKTAAGCTALLVTLGLILNIVRSIRIIYIRIRP